MKKVILTRGLPGCGKTTWAKAQVLDFPSRFRRVSKDDLRAMLDSGKWSKHNEKFVLQIRDTIIIRTLQEGKHVIVDDTNLHPKHEAHIKELVKGMATVEVKHFETTLEECILRDKLRPNSVGEDVIRDMYNSFIKPKPKKVLMDKSLPSAYIVDIDGTLAQMKGRSPYDWHLVKTDEVKEDVARVIQNLSNRNDIIICTGRDGICENDTKQWLFRNDIPWKEFHIRPQGNTEDDSIIKRRVLEDVIKRYNVLGVFDDRDKVVEMWRDAGLTCFQVDYGNF